MYDIDIVNCQPLLLVAYLTENDSLDFDLNYKNDCEDGLFYERFYDIDRPKNISNIEWRSEIKVKLYKSIFFSFNKKSKINKKFKELYPKTWESLEKISITDISLASRLQNLESNLFNNIIPKHSEFYFTLFDAIYFNNIMDKYKIENEIKNYFNNFNIKVTTK